MYLKLHISFLFILFSVCLSFAQETKEDVEKKALSYFKNEQFIEATPLYLRLLSLEPRNPDYNYRYGTCLLFNSDEKKSAFKYLNYAVLKGDEVENEAYYYLGKAYHLTYQFDKAIKNYQIYKQKAGSRALSKLNVDRQIEMCKNGKSSITDVSEIIVLNKTEIDENSFFRIYDLKDIGGELIVTAEFQTRQDKRNNHVPLIHFPAQTNRIFYSSYGEKGDNKDIFFRNRLPDGSWSLEQPVLGEVNTPYNEDYPYMHTSGKFLYFSSEGHNSMGGYDIFRSPYDPETNSFGKPENMGISISSPDNDLLYIVDSLDRHAYFASQRESENKKIHVYNVRVERFPMQMVILKGQFNSTIHPNEKSLSITVNNSSGDFIGEFKTSATGEYLIHLPRGGKYEFIVSVGNKEQQHRQIIDFPYLKEFRPLKQVITETEQEREGERAEIIVFKNLFDERFDDESIIIAEAIALKSKMEVNKDEFDLNALDELKEQQKLYEQLGLSEFSAVEIHDLIKSKHANLLLRQKNTEESIQKSFATINSGQDKIEKALNKADSLMRLAKTTENKGRAARYTQLAQKELQKAKDIQTEMEYAQVVLDFLEEDLEKHKEVLATSQQLDSEVRGIDVSDDEALRDLLNKHLEFVNNELLKETKINAHFEYLSEINEKLADLEDIKANQRKVLADQKALLEKLEELKVSHKTASKRNKGNIEMEMNKIENQLSDLDNELKYINDKIEASEELEGQKAIIAQITNEKQPEDKFLKAKTEERNEELKKIYTELDTENNEFAANNEIDLSKEEPDEIVINNVVPNDSLTQEINETIEIPEEIVQTNEPNKTEEINQISSSIEEIFAEIDPEYSAEIQKLETEVENGVKTKKDLLKRKQKALVSVKNLKSETTVLKQNGENTPALVQKIELLNQLENQLETEIFSLEQAIADEEIHEPQEEFTFNQNEQDEINQQNEQAILEKNNAEFQQEISPLLKEFHAGQDNHEALLSAYEKHLTELKEALNTANLSDQTIHHLKKEEEKAIAFISILKSAQSNEQENTHATFDKVIKASALSKDELQLMDHTPISKEEAEKKAAVIDKVIQQANLMLDESEDDFEIRYLNQVKKELEKQRRNIRFDFGEVTQTKDLIASDEGFDEFQEEFSEQLSDHQVQEFQSLYEAKSDLLAAEKENPTLINNKKHQKKVEKLENKITSKENEVITQVIESQSQILSESLQETEYHEQSTPALLQAQQNEIAIERLITASVKEKDPKAKQKLLKSAHQKQEEAIQKIKEEQQQEEVKKIVQEIISSNQYENITSNNALKTEEDYKEEQNNIGIQLLDIKNQINEIDALISKAKKKEKPELRRQKEKLIDISKKLEDKYNQNAAILAEIEQQNTQDANKGVAENAIENHLSYLEEIEIAQSETYKQLLKNSNQLLQLQSELRIKENQLVDEQNELKQITSAIADMAHLASNYKNKTAQQLEQINKTTGEIKVLRKEILAQQKEIQAKLASERLQKEKIENMIVRDVAPLTKAPTLPITTTGLVISNENKNQYSDRNPIPLNITPPKGLVFRVQIGAFSKPVPNNTFTEFSPITGDVVRPGLIRYVAGFFNSRNDATEARNKIRSMGYSDAFVVAYCDGERIPVYRAIELMNSGACVPSITASENLIVNANEATENTSLSFTEEIDEFAYNKAPGAVEAEATELKMGLYFTVQVGVYNKPISAAQIFNITPLVTKRLPNGQIRYSSGIFNSVQQAKPKQLEAINKGVSDAFITAYYQGERISIAQAQQLLNEKGEGILEANNPTISNRNKIKNQPSAPTFPEKDETFLNRKETQSILVSKTSYDVYPTSIINHYNDNGNLFYYDSITQKIKSFIYDDGDKITIPNDDFEVIHLYDNSYIVNDINALKRSEALLDAEKDKIILHVKIKAEDLNSDLLETILHAPVNKKMTTNSSHLTVDFYTLDTSNYDLIINNLQIILNQLGATEVIKQKKALSNK